VLTISDGVADGTREDRSGDLLGELLSAEGFEVDTAEDGEQGLATARRAEGYDVIVLDWTLPKLSGIDVCRTLRSESAVAIIMLTAKETEVDRVLGLEMGADDYVVKPFSTKELVSRVRAVIRRQALEQGRGTTILRIGRLSLDPSRHRVEVDGKPVHLTPTELAREAGMHRREVITKCMQMGVPIFEGRIDKTLFMATLKDDARTANPSLAKA